MPPGSRCTSIRAFMWSILRGDMPRRQLAADVSWEVNTDRLNRILRNMGGNTSTAVRQVAFAVEGHAKMGAPVDTGALKNSIYTRMGNEQAPRQAADVAIVPLPEPENKQTAHVGPSVEYGIYVELGTARAHAQPYLAPAVAAVADELESNPDVFVPVVTDDR